MRCRHARKTPTPLRRQRILYDTVLGSCKVVERKEMLTYPRGSADDDHLLVLEFAVVFGHGASDVDDKLRGTCGNDLLDRLDI